MVHFSAVVVLACSLSAISTPLSRRTVAQVEADIASITSQVTALDTAINNFPDSGGSLVAALAIHTGATTLETAINKGTTDVKSTGPVSEADGTTILGDVQAIITPITDALTKIVAKRPAFEALPLGGVPALVKQDLNTLNTDTSAFEAALIAAAPADLVGQANSIKATLDAAFAKAIAGYATA